MPYIVLYIKYHNLKIRITVLFVNIYKKIIKNKGIFFMISEHLLIYNIKKTEPHLQELKKSEIWS